MMVYEVLPGDHQGHGHRRLRHARPVNSQREPPFFLTWGLDTQRTVWTAEDGAEWNVWEFAPPEPTEKTVVAFHGGGFILRAQHH